MTRLRRGVPVLLAFIALAVAAAPTAQAKVKHRHVTHVQPLAPAKFPVYVDTGSDRNPGGDNLYFTDTKNPNYIVGPAWFQRWEDR